DGGPEQRGFAVGAGGDDRGTGGGQPQRPHVAAERAVDVVGLAADGAGDRPADREEAGSGGDRDGPAGRHACPQGGVEAHPGPDGGGGGGGVEADRLGPVAPLDGETAAVLGTVAVAATEAAGDQAAARRPGHRASQAVDVGAAGGDDRRRRRGRAAPAGQQAGVGDQYGRSGTGRRRACSRRRPPTVRTTLRATLRANHGSWASWRAALTRRAPRPPSRSARYSASDRVRPTYRKRRPPSSSRPIARVT